MELALGPKVWISKQNTIYGVWLDHHATMASFRQEKNAEWPASPTALGKQFHGGAECLIFRGVHTHFGVKLQPMAACNRC
jgi:hypothetical protein